MWHYTDAQRLRHQVQHASSPLVQSAYDLLLGLKGVGVTLLLEGEGGLQVPGFLEQVSPRGLNLTLAAPLPELGAGAPLQVEAMTGPGIHRFHTTPRQPVPAGATRLDLHLPRQVESIQRRQFSRISLTVPVVFAPGLDSARAEGGYGGHGQSLDLSVGGMRMLTHTPLRQGQHLYVSFTIPNGAAFRGISARVVRSHSDGTRCTVALQFTDLAEPVTAQLLQTMLQLRANGLTKR